MAARPGANQRTNGIPREKICQFKLVLLGEYVLPCALSPAFVYSTLYFTLYYMYVVTRCHLPDIRYRITMIYMHRECIYSVIFKLYCV